MRWINDTYLERGSEALNEMAQVKWLARRPTQVISPGRTLEGLRPFRLGLKRIPSKRSEPPSLPLACSHTALGQK